MCYRTVALVYHEPAVPNSKVNGVWNRPYSSVLFTRLGDDKAVEAFGTDNDLVSVTADPDNRRMVSASLLAGYQYTVTIIPPVANPSFRPVNTTVVMMDVGGCQGSVDLLFPPPGLGSSWQTISDNPTRWVLVVFETRISCFLSLDNYAFAVAAQSPPLDGKSCVFLRVPKRVLFSLSCGHRASQQSAHYDH